ncbi:MAG: DUF1801 domain-containing protein [Candidatus Eisenbacteria bacterium]
MRTSTAATIDDYIATFPPRVRAILQRIRRTVRAAAPGAREVISYRMPAFKQHGILLYFAAFKEHIGVFPPVRGDVKLVGELAPWAGEKGNLRFPLDEPMPYGLIERIVKLRVKQDAAKAGLAPRPAVVRAKAKAARAVRPRAAAAKRRTPAKSSAQPRRARAR